MIPVSPRRSPVYIGSGTTGPFAFEFKVFAATDIEVTRADLLNNNTVLTLGADYTVALNSNQDAFPGGSITLTSALAAGFRLVITGKLPYQQSTQLPNGGNYNARVVEQALDKIVVQVQQLKEGLDRSLRLAVTSGDASVELPVAEPVNLIGWNADADGLRNFNPAELGVEVAYATWRTQAFNGTGAQTDFVLDFDAGNASNIDLLVNNVPQVAGVNFSYTRSTRTITFLTGAPSAGTGNVVARYGEALPEPSIAAAIAQAEAARDAALAAETNAELAETNAETAQAAAAASATAAATSATNASNSATAAADSAIAADNSADAAALSATAASTSATNAANSATAAATSASNAAATLANIPGRNKLINGRMDVDQRNGGSAQTIIAAAALAYTVDRWYAYCTGANVTGQRVAGTAPNRFNYRFTGAASVTKIGFAQRIEAASCQDLAGQTATLSVDLANSLLTTVTWTAWRANTDDTFGTLASPTRTQIATGTFTVNSTLTRYSTQISVPSAATTGIEVEFSVGAQTSGTFTVGRAQLEIGAVATPFEHRPVGQELALCQRYYQLGAAAVNSQTSGLVGGGASFTVPMRATPTMVRTGTFLSSGEAGTNFVPANERAFTYTNAAALFAGGNFTASAEL